MFELYFRCPTTGEPIYAGFHSIVNDRTVSSIFRKSSICPACGGTHDWQTEAVWTAIPVALPSHAAPELGSPAEPEKEKLPKVA